jgi:branched-chain amino acid aminotransferase
MQLRACHRFRAKIRFIVNDGFVLEEDAGMSMSDRDGVIWYDGALVPWREANTHVLTHSLHYGLAVFEGVRAYQTEIGTAIFRLAEHTQRLLNSAKIYQMQVPYTKDELMAAQREVVRANGLASCYLRPLAFYGSEKMGVSPIGAKVHVAIAAWLTWVKMASRKASASRRRAMPATMST